MDFELELVAIPVSDVDWAKAFQPTTQASRQTTTSDPDRNGWAVQDISGSGG